MDKLAFQNACEKTIPLVRAKNGIGTLGEKTLHAVLKQYFENHEENQEVKIGGYVVDIVGENGVIEIQTAGFDKLRKKLTVMLEVATVTVVYPISKIKWILWIDEETGETTQKRKSPRQGTPYFAFFELYKIKSLLMHKNLRLCFVLLEVEEYRSLNGWSHDKKRGSSRYDRIPVDILEEITIGCSKDYQKLIPESLPPAFTSKDFQKAAGLSLSGAQTALNVLFAVGAVRRTGKQGNQYVYERE